MWSSTNYLSFLASATLSYQAARGEAPTICGAGYNLEKVAITCHDLIS
jgi:hypothetical protein